MRATSQAHVYDAVRTPFGRFGGCLEDHVLLVLAEKPFQGLLQGGTAVVMLREPREPVQQLV